MAEAVDAVLLLGPTASGKSALAMQLAEKIPFEIVSVDSAQVYRGMDIGTAKPSAEDRTVVPHHLIDIRDPADPYSAAEFVRDATIAIREIRERGKLPLLVGGTMLYAKALREGLSELPSADPTLRKRLDVEAREGGWPALHARLAEVDPRTAARLKPNDSQRIQRALEVFESSGAPMSELLEAEITPRLTLSTIALMPADRAQLHTRIEHRFDAMLGAGFLEEVRALHARGDLHQNSAFDAKRRLPPGMAVDRRPEHVRRVSSGCDRCHSAIGEETDDMVTLDERCNRCRSAVARRS